MYDVVISLPITKEMQKEIKKTARDQEISMNQFCRDAIRSKLKKDNKKDVEKDNNR